MRVVLPQSLTVHSTTLKVITDHYYSSGGSTIVTSGTSLYRESEDGSTLFLKGTSQKFFGSLFGPTHRGGRHVPSFVWRDRTRYSLFWSILLTI